MQSTLDYGTKSNTIQLKFKTLDSHWLSSSSFKCRFFPSLFFIYFFLFLYGMMNFFLFFPSSNKKTAFKTVLLFTKQIKTFFFTAESKERNLLSKFVRVFYFINTIITASYIRTPRTCMLLMSHLFGQLKFVSKSIWFCDFSVFFYFFFCFWLICWFCVFYARSLFFSISAYLFLSTSVLWFFFVI